MESTSKEVNKKEESYDLEREGRFKGVGPKVGRRSDEKIKEDVCDLLMQVPNVDCSEIGVSVNGGVVTLKGTVGERPMKRLVEETIEYVPGIQDVRNELHIQSGSGPGKAKGSHIRQWQRPPKRTSTHGKAKRI